jgi:Protein of unknown function (DUF421)
MRTPSGSTNCADQASRHSNTSTLRRRYQHHAAEPCQLRHRPAPEVRRRPPLLKSEGRTDSMWFDSWYDLARILVVGPVAYAVLVAVLRLTGKRTLSKLNAFDLVVTVALGSTLATSFLSSEVSAAEGALGLVVLVVLQYVVTWTSIRVPRVASLVKSEPTLMYHDGFLESALRRQRVTVDEVRQAARAQGHADLHDVTAVVLETDGSFSILIQQPQLTEK